MKKYLFLLFAVTGMALASQAQTSAPKDTKVKTAHTKMKMKPKKSVANRVHNAIHPNRKEYSGAKMKREVKKS